MADGLNGLTAEEVVALLQLQPHPEGGHFRETFRDAQSGRDGASGRDAAGGARGASTAIYFLLKEGQRSHWHRVDAAEVWHWHAGAPLTLAIADGEGRRELALGPDLKAGERPQAVVPPFAWQAAQSRGAWTLVGCTVAPAFQFEGFELAPPGWEPDEGPA